MAENKLYKAMNPEPTWDWDNEDRIVVDSPDRTPMFLQGKALQDYKDGKLGQQPMTPERQRLLDEMDEEMQRIVAELYRNDSKEP